MKTNDLRVRRGVSVAKDAGAAASELFRAIGGDQDALHVFFCTSSFDLPQLASALKREFGKARLIGCTTAGEITPVGYLEGTITGFSIGGRGIHAETLCLEDLANFEFSRGEALVEAAFTRFRALELETSSSNMFALLFIDGLAAKEEVVLSSLAGRLGGVQLVGGSAADGVAFGQTHVYFDGEFRSDRAVFTLVRCETPFYVFKTEHFLPSSERLVVTAADPARRIVTEINGAPAAREYARLIGFDVDALSPLSFARHPVVVTVGDTPYVRSIQKVNDDESLSFFCAIDVGIVLRVAAGVDMLDDLNAAFTKVRARIGVPELIIGCDCVLRAVEARERDITGLIGRVMAANNVVGFATYGEQFNGMHVNQTFTGVALGRPR